MTSVVATLAAATVTAVAHAPEPIAPVPRAAVPLAIVELMPPAADRFEAAAVATPVPGVTVARAPNAVPLVLVHVVATAPADVVQSPVRAGMAAAGKFVALARLIADGVPSAGVVRLGDVPNTGAPEPVAALASPVATPVPGVIVANAPKDVPLVLVQVIAPPDACVQSPETLLASYASSAFGVVETAGLAV